MLEFVDLVLPDASARLADNAPRYWLSSFGGSAKAIVEASDAAMIEAI
jgi:hypothetical protein